MLRASLAASCIGDVALAWNMPVFSWETLPVAFHSSNPSGPYSDEELGNISKFATVTFEKWQGLQTYVAKGFNWETCQNGSDVSKCGCCVEDEMADMGRRLKRLRSDIMVFEYLNSNLAYPHYRLGHSIAAMPDLWTRNSSDGEILFGGDGHWVYPDLAKRESQDMWYDAVWNLTRSGFIDGAFVDGCAKSLPDMSPERQTGKIAMLRRLQTDIPGPVICGSNGKVEDGLAGSQIQNWGKGGQWSLREIPMLQRAVEKGALFQAHGKCPDDLSDPQTINNLAAFLVAAGPYSYYVCGGWNSASTEWLAVYDRPLGEPLGDAILSQDGVWSRSFRHGVSVTFDTQTESGTISWNSEFSV